MMLGYVDHQLKQIANAMSKSQNSVEGLVHHLTENCFWFIPILA